MNDWISVKDRLPPERETVETMYPNGIVGKSHTFINAIGYKTWSEYYGERYPQNVIGPISWRPLLEAQKKSTPE